MSGSSTETSLPKRGPDIRGIIQLLVLDSHLQLLEDGSEYHSQETGPEDAGRLFAELVGKLEEYGSVEMMAQIALIEGHSQASPFHSVYNQAAKNTFGTFLSGLFLNHHNRDAGPVRPEIREEIIHIVLRYFESLAYGLLPEDAGSSSPLLSRKKLVFDTSPRCLDDQKNSQIGATFARIDGFLLSEFGFTANDAVGFAGAITDAIGESISEKHEQAEEKFKKDGVRNSEPQTAEEEEYSGRSYFADSYFLPGSSKILTIDADGFCKQNGIGHGDRFARFLEALSCSFGDQLDGFEDPMSENILSFRPFIRLDGGRYFCPQAGTLIPRLDFILENLLAGEEQRQTAVWNRYEQAKSEFLGDAMFDFLSRVFPAGTVHRNLFYQTDERAAAAELVIIYDNKILIAESGANYLIMMEKREGLGVMEEEIKGMVQDAYQRARDVRDYIRSADTAVFTDGDGKEVLRIDSKDGYQFIFIGVTLETLDIFQPALLESLEVPDGDDYPWLVNLFDLDIITDCIPSPAYFLHYLHQRVRAQKGSIFSAVTEEALLGFYFEYGNFYESVLAKMGNPVFMVQEAGYFERFKDYYVRGEKKPALEVPQVLSDLIRNMEKYRQRGFTDVTNVLLDFPTYERQDLGKGIKKSLKKMESSRGMDGFSKWIPGHDVGFAYFISDDMTGFYKNAKKNMMDWRYKEKITRGAMIGRNYKDKKNLATFFYYVDEPWKYDQSQEDDVASLERRVYGVK